MKSCAVISAGDIDDLSILNLCSSASYIICADGGYIHALNAGIRPDVVVGDFDTFLGEVPNDIECIKHPSEKDDTDTMLAIKLAIDRGYKDITIFGATGGRIDHTFANIQAIAYATQHGCSARIISGKTTIMHIEDDNTVLPNIDGILSVFAYTDVCKGVSISGAKYSLDSATISNTFPIGASNEFVNSDVQIRVDSGALLIIVTQR